MKCLFALLYSLYCFFSCFAPWDICLGQCYRTDYIIWTMPWTVGKNRPSEFLAGDCWLRTLSLRAQCLRFMRGDPNMRCMIGKGVFLTVSTWHCAWRVKLIISSSGRIDNHLGCRNIAVPITVNVEGSPSVTSLLRGCMINVSKCR